MSFRRVILYTCNHANIRVSYRSYLIHILQYEEQEMITTDILIIGAGITGTALARELSRYEASVCIVDRACDVADGATKANSGIVHAGYDAKPGTLKARYNVRGARLYENLCNDLSVPYSRVGALVTAFSDEDTATLRSLLSRGEENGVEDLRIVRQPELSVMEPNLNPMAVAALLVPGSAIVSPYELAFALADDAAVNGVRFFFDEPVLSVAVQPDRTWLVNTASLQFSCRAVVNCAGSSGADLHNMISSDKLEMIHRRGQYFLLDRMSALPFSHTVFQCPTRMGKGVLISPTVHGNLIIGPNAEDIEDPFDTSTTGTGLSEVLSKASMTWPDISTRSNITNFSGIRAHLPGDDFLVGAVHGCSGAFEAIGIESPGLSSAPAIAEDLSRQIALFLTLKYKKNILPYPVPPKPFNLMNDLERETALSVDPLHGNIICRCEVVTEAEIRSAIRRPVGARTIDGIKRRTRAGMGRCQGGFCSPRVAAILAEELRCTLGEITKSGGSSRILSGTVSSLLKGGDLHA